MLWTKCNKTNMNTIKLLKLSTMAIETKYCKILSNFVLHVIYKLYPLLYKIADLKGSHGIFFRPSVFLANFSRYPYAGCWC